ncbi:MAG: hypothetical protein P4N59_32620 [Negativicutes bacterium]|nr:hypothetical protein [Negativicutes bacterium]
MNAQEEAHGLFKERVVCGMLEAGLISVVLGTELPGPGSFCLSQNLKFLSPAEIGDTTQRE